MQRRTFSRSEPERYGRLAGLDSRIDTESGEFDMVMASEGEATDGHILSIKGLRMPKEMPLQLDHSPRALANLGTVTKMRRDKKDGVPIMRGVGQIRLSGEGEALEARRDLVDAIATGAVRNVSLTWEANRAVERRDLPKGHPAFVPRDEANPRKRFGLFFPESEGVEQSIVGVGSDRSAIIGRSEAATNDVSREMWRSIVQRLDVAPRSREVEIIDALERSVRDLEVRCADAEAAIALREEEPPDPPSFELLLEDLVRRMDETSTRDQQGLADTLEGLLARIA